MASGADYVYEEANGGGNYSFGEGDADRDCLMMIQSDQMPMREAIQNWIALVVYPILLLQGIVGNLLALPVLRGVSCSSWSTVTYLLVVGVTDLLFLLVHCGDDWYASMTSVRLSVRFIGSSDAVCRTYSFLFTFTTHLNPWLYVAISVETLIATRWPKLTYTMCTVERSKYVMMLITIILVCLDINQFWTMGIRRPGGCMYTEEFSDNLREWILPALANAVEHVLPLVFVSICLILAAWTFFRRSSEQQKQLEDDMKKYFIELSTLRDFRTICLVVCSIFMCLAATNVTFTVIDLLVSQLSCTAMTKYSQVMNVLLVIKKTLTFTFYGAKVYLYLTMSRSFRSRLKSKLLGAFWKLRKLAAWTCRCGQRWTPVALHENGDTDLCLSRRGLDTKEGAAACAAPGHLGPTPSSARSIGLMTTPSGSNESKSVVQVDTLPYEGAVNTSTAQTLARHNNGIPQV